MGNITLYFLASSYSTYSPGFAAANSLAFARYSLMAILLTALIAFVLFVVSGWKVFEKANQPGWASIVPIYNFVVLLHVVRKPIWWVILSFVPIVNIVVSIIVAHELAKAFGKGVGFTIGLIILPIIFLPVLGFGKATYIYTSSPEIGMPVSGGSEQV